MAYQQIGPSGNVMEVNSAKAGHVTLYDANGNEFESVTGPNGDRYLGTALIQDVHASATNNYAGTISGSGVWLGISEDTLNSAGIQVCFYSDQACTVQVEQAGDGINFRITDSWSRAAGLGDARTFQAVGNRFRIRVTNQTGVIANVELNCYLCPTVEALPRALSQLGNLKISNQETQPYADCSTGTLFSAVFEVSAANTDTHYLLLKNPSSTVDMVVHKVFVDCLVLGRLTVGRIWADNTGALTGTPVGVVCRRRKGVAPSSAMTALSTPSLTPGTQIGTVSSSNGTDLNPFEGGLIIGPGKNMSVSLLASTGGTSTAITVVWAEVLSL
jgi:hypothetical protein